MNTGKNYESCQGCLENGSLKNIFKGISMWKLPIFLWFSVHGNSEKENNFLESRGQRVFLILKSHIYKLSNSPTGCHVADANLRATLNFPDHAHSIWMNFGVLCSNSEGWYRAHYSRLPISYPAIKKCIFHFCSSRLHEGQQDKKLNGIQI